MHIKICGLRTAPAVLAACEAGADMVGFVFVPKSPRYIEDVDAIPLIRQAQAHGAKAVGLFANEDPISLARRGLAMGLDVVQLHGAEAPEIIAMTKAALTDKAKGLDHALTKIMVARGVSGFEDLESLSSLVADYFLFDAKPPTGNNAHGGHGQAFDWTVLQGYQGEVPWLLAGGLTPQNVAKAIASVNEIRGFSGVDVSSGVERIRGEKDVGLITDFVATARAAMGHSS
ncbi:MAG: phosphoribosylanthranilate isomerase [Pseudomonadota bacterium]